MNGLLIIYNEFIVLGISLFKTAVLTSNVILVM